MSSRMMVSMIDSFQKSQKRSRDLQVTRDTNRMKEEELDIRKQTLDLKKKEFEARGQMNPMVKAMIDIEYQRIKGKKEVLDYGNQEAGKSLTKENQQQKAFMKDITYLQKLSAIENAGQGSATVSADGKVGFKLANSSEAKLTRDQKVESMIDAGGDYSENRFKKITDRKKMESTITAKHGVEWKKNKKLVDKFNAVYKEEEDKYEVGEVYEGTKRGKKGNYEYLGEGEFKKVK